MIILTLCTRLPTLVTMESRKTHVEHSETGESADQETNVFQDKDFTCRGTPPKIARTCRENNNGSSLVSDKI